MWWESETISEKISFLTETNVSEKQQGSVWCCPHGGSVVLTVCARVCWRWCGGVSKSKLCTPQRGWGSSWPLTPQWLPLQCEGSNLPAGRTQCPQSKLQHNAVLNTEPEPQEHRRIYLLKRQTVSSLLKKNQFSCLYPPALWLASRHKQRALYIMA